MAGGQGAKTAGGYPTYRAIALIQKSIDVYWAQVSKAQQSS